jgi:hypothetical protein
MMRAVRRLAVRSARLFALIATFPNDLFGLTEGGFSAAPGNR